MRTAIAIGLFVGIVIGVIGCGGESVEYARDAGADAQTAIEAQPDLMRAGPGNCTWNFTYDSATGMTTSYVVCTDAGTD